MTEKKAILLGASGLVGNELLHLLIHDNYFTHIHILSRKPLSIQHTKVTVECIDFLDGTSLEAAITECDTVFCCIGTTQKQVQGNKHRYRDIDYGIPIRVAQVCKQKHINHFSLVSSIGANSTSSNFYLHLKGETEQALQQFPIPSIAIFRPSMLLGNRTQSRPAETISKYIMQAISWLIPATYKPIHARKVAYSMLWYAKQKLLGVQIVENKYMM